MEIDTVLKEFGNRNGIELSFDENDACALELSDGRVMLLQERVALNELDFVATLGTVPEELRASVFTDLMAANFYWQETFGATLSWNVDLEEVVLMYPLSLDNATPETVVDVFSRFVDLQAVWAGRFAELVAGAQERMPEVQDEDDAEDSSADADAGMIINP